MKRLKFEKEEEVTNREDDSRSFRYVFRLVSLELVGKPEEAANTTEHRLTVKIAGNRLSGWGLQCSERDLVKILFEIGRRAVEKKVQEGMLGEKHLENVTTTTHSNKLPFDPSRLDEPDAKLYYVREERKIGFK